MGKQSTTITEEAVFCEPQCSPFHYHEQMLEKMIDVKYKVESFSNKLDRWEKIISEKIATFDENLEKQKQLEIESITKLEEAFAEKTEGLDEIVTAKLSESDVKLGQLQGQSSGITTKQGNTRKLSSVVLGKDTTSTTNEEESFEGENEAKEIIKEEVQLPKCFKNRLAFVLYNVFTEKECKEYIQKTEKKGYDLALINIGGGLQMKMKDVRNSSRCIWDSNEEADRIWQRIKSYIPETWGGRQVMGLNERLRFLRYNPGEYFKTHMDGEYRRDNGERSFITIQLYLNEGFKGGSTTFFDYSDKESIEVVPKTGMVLVFQHDILHEGSLLKKGVKYSMRTDVMYSAQRIQVEKEASLAKKTTKVEKDTETSNSTSPVEHAIDTNNTTSDVEQSTEPTQDTSVAKQDIDPIEKTTKVVEKTESSNNDCRNGVEEAI